MKTKLDSPGVMIPPPLIYIAIFLLSILLQSLFSINYSIFHTLPFEIAATTLIAVASLVFMIPSLVQFIKTKNTIVLIRPASSLQTSGTYLFSRNPMYLGLLLLYIGLAIVIGNWWTLILVPLLIIVVSHFVIKPEERYLLREFGESYSKYKLKVRRWL